MCLLSYFPSGVMPDSQHLRNGAQVNADGHGWAIVKTDKSAIITFRSLDADDAIKTFVKARDQHPDTPAMFHSRWGTSGQATRYNCHPFRVPGMGNTVLAHNGVLYQPPVGDKRCDTRHFAEEVMPRRYFRLDKLGVQNAIRQYIGNDKILVLTVNPVYQSNAYLFGEERGHWLDSGAWHSNYDYAGWSQAKYDWSGWEDCYFCGEKKSVGPIYGRCHHCWICSYCGVEAKVIGACGCEYATSMHASRTYTTKSGTTSGQAIVIGPPQKNVDTKPAVTQVIAAQARLADAWNTGTDNLPVVKKALPLCCDGHYTQQIPTGEPCQ